MTSFAVATVYAGSAISLSIAFGNHVWQLVTFKQFKDKCPYCHIRDQLEKQRWHKWYHVHIMFEKIVNRDRQNIMSHLEVVWHLISVFSENVLNRLELGKRVHISLFHFRSWPCNRTFLPENQLVLWNMTNATNLRRVRNYPPQKNCKTSSSLDQYIYSVWLVKVIRCVIACKEQNARAHFQVRQ